MTIESNSLIEILRWRATHEGHRLAYRFLADGELAAQCLTYGELDDRAKALAARIGMYGKNQERALLLLPAGLDFIVSFFGCLYAKVIPVPLPPPHPARIEFSMETTQRIINDARPRIALLSRSLLEAIESKAKIKSVFKEIELLGIPFDELISANGTWHPPQILPEELAFLQYTSGSTSAPKGVMVSHSNLMQNLGLIEKSFGQSREKEGVIWLPPYHDMGLIGGILQPLFSGYAMTLMPHMMFIQKPIRWLQAISRFKATTSGGPNFAYDLCLKKVKPEYLHQLDLSTWEVAFCGAEPVSSKTIKGFSELFAAAGFREEAFLPCYGLAEATLLVTGGPKMRTPVLKNLKKSSLEKHEVVLHETNEEDTITLVGCGQIDPSQKIRIVDPETRSTCPPEKIGEIWIKGPIVTQGYWEKPQETADTFKAQLADTSEGPFLRTGDLGFVLENELFVTGRIKNMIIIDGRNHYPHDIEKTVEQSHPSIQPLGCAVFAIEDSGKEQVVILVEILHRAISNSEEIKKSIRKAVSEHHEIPISDIKLVLPGIIPRTTSGKIKHFQCKENYLSETLKELEHI